MVVEFWDLLKAATTMTALTYLAFTVCRVLSTLTPCWVFPDVKSGLSGVKSGPVLSLPVHGRADDTHPRIFMRFGVGTCL